MEFTLKGQKIELQDEIFKDNGIKVIFGRNGIGKSTIVDGLEYANNNDSSVRVKDEITGIKEDFTQIPTEISEKIKVIRSATSDSEYSFSGDDVLIFKNAKEITYIEEEIKEFKRDANTKKGLLGDVRAEIEKHKEIKNIIEQDIKSVFKMFGIAKDKVDIDKISKWEEKKPFVIRVFSDINNFNLYLESSSEYLLLYEKYKDKIIKKVDEKNFINSSNLDFYEQLINFLEDNTSHFDHDNCIICRAETNNEINIEDIKEKIESVKKSMNEEIVNFIEERSVYFENLSLDINYKNFFANDLFNSIKGYYNTYKEHSLEDEYKALIKISMFNIIEKYERIQKLKKEIPEITDTFERNFIKRLKAVYSLKDFHFKTNGKRITLTSGNGIPISKELVSTSMAKMISFLYEIAFIESDNILVFDDPIDSNDIMNISFIIDQLEELASNNNVIVFTHDYTFLDELSRRAKTDNNEKVGA